MNFYFFWYYFDKTEYNIYRLPLVFLYYCWLYIHVALKGKSEVFLQTIQRYMQDCNKYLRWIASQQYLSKFSRKLLLQSSPY